MLARPVAPPGLIRPSQRLGHLARVEAGFLERLVVGGAGPGVGNTRLAHLVGTHVVSDLDIRRLGNALHGLRRHFLHFGHDWLARRTRRRNFRSHRALFLELLHSLRAGLGVGDTRLAHLVGAHVVEMDVPYITGLAAATIAYVVVAQFEPRAPAPA